MTMLPLGRWFRDIATDGRNGPLPGLLLALTLGTGMVDAVSVVGLHRVFVANMTGNLAFIGFAVAGAPGFSLTASVTALAGFAAGALEGSRLSARWSDHRGHVLRNTLALEIVLAGAMTILAAVAGPGPPPAARYLMLVVLGAAMGSQNAAVRRIGVPDLTTTNVVTSTLTGLLADSLTRSWDASLSRRLAALLAISGGAAVGAVLVLDASLAAALGAATGLLILVAAATHLFSAGTPDWSRPPRP